MIVYILIHPLEWFLTINTAVSTDKDGNVHGKAYHFLCFELRIEKEP